MNTRYIRCAKCGCDATPTSVEPGTSTTMRCPDCCEPAATRCSPPYATMCRECCPTGHQTHGVVGESSIEHDRRRPPIRKIVALLALLAILPPYSRADDLPDAPAPKDSVSIEVRRFERQVRREHIADKKFLVVVATLGAAKALDMVTTRRMLDRGYYETDPIYSRYPSNARLVFVTGSYFAAEVCGAWLLKRYGKRHAWAKLLWLGEPAFQTQEHVRFAIHNERLR